MNEMRGILAALHDDAPAPQEPAAAPKRESLLWSAATPATGLMCGLAGYFQQNPWASKVDLLAMPATSDAFFVPMPSLIPVPAEVARAGSASSAEVHAAASLLSISVSRDSLRRAAIVAGVGGGDVLSLPGSSQYLPRRYQCRLCDRTATAIPLAGEAAPVCTDNGRHAPKAMYSAP